MLSLTDQSRFFCYFINFVVFNFQKVNDVSIHGLSMLKRIRNCRIRRYKGLPLRFDLYMGFVIPNTAIPVTLQAIMHGR